MKKLLLALSLGMSSIPALFAETGVVYLDVRTPEEIKEKSLSGAEALDFKSPDFKDKMSKLDKTKTYKVFCRSGNRAGKAVEMMKAQGFTHVENVGSLEDAEKLKKKEMAK